MCGLAGFARLGTHSQIDEVTALLQAMTRAVAHRGPDDTVRERFGAVDLGFVRLSLVDPEGGAQPLSTDDGSLVLIANGEIYNHRELAATLPADVRLRTRSDCEVLLHLYRRDGLRFLDAVRGMFALVLWDRRANQLIFARDRFGIKPVFYHQDSERIVFGSEIKALFEDPRTPRVLDWERAIGDQVLTGDPSLAAEPVHAWFKDIHLVPAATILRFDLASGACESHQYWRFPQSHAIGEGAEADLVRTYGELLADSVRECGMADVEIGLFLSGGIDSAAVAALADPRPHTFTALNASTLVNQDAEYGNRIARGLGLANDQILLDARHRPGTAEWKQHLWLLESPIAGPESFYKYEMYRYVREHAPQIKAMLLGVGSDEFNGGYSSTIATGGDWSDFVAKVERMDLQRHHNARPDLGAWWGAPGPALVRPDAVRGASGVPVMDSLDAFHLWKYRVVQQYNCWHEDRTAAGNGIEARVPFLDHRLIELTAAVPRDLRPSLLWNKQILRRALRGVLPQEFLNRPKLAFFYGDGVRYTFRMLATMLSQDGGSLVEEALSAPGAKQYLDADAVRAALALVCDDPSKGSVELLLHVVNLGLLEQMARDVPAPPVSVARAAVPESITIRDWDSAADQITARVLRRSRPEPSDVLALPEDALLLRDDHQPETWYLVLQGLVEFVLDPADDPDWLAFLRAVDGRRSFAEVLDVAGVEIEAIEDLLGECLDTGILHAHPSAEALALR